MSIIHRLKKLEQSAIPKCSDNHKIFQTYVDDEPERDTPNCAICGKRLSLFVVRVATTSSIEE